MAVSRISALSDSGMFSGQVCLSMSFDYSLSLEPRAVRQLRGSGQLSQALRGSASPLRFGSGIK